MIYITVLASPMAWMRMEVIGLPIIGEASMQIIALGTEFTVSLPYPDAC